MSNAGFKESSGLQGAKIRRGDAAEIPGDYQHRARTAGPVVQRFWHAERERLVRIHSPPAPGETVLDIGCGSGVVTDVLGSLDAHVIGIDANLAAVEYARATFGRERVEFRHGLIGEVEFASSSFDRFYCLEVVEHLYFEQVRALFTRLHGWGRAGAILTVTTPNYLGPWPLLEFGLDRLRLVPRLVGDQHVSRFWPKRLAHLLRDTGWQVEKLSTFCTFAPFVSALSWSVAERVAAVEDRLRLPFGNLVFAVARRL